MNEWIKYEMGNGYDKYFNYYHKIIGKTTYEYRTIKSEWVGRITPDLEHLPLKELEEALS